LNPYQKAEPPHTVFPLRAFLFPKKSEKADLSAAEDQKNRNDQDPNAVVIKKIAKAVVIHKYPPFAEWSAILAMKINLIRRSDCFFPIC
jgi:hypothetical protein